MTEPTRMVLRLIRTDDGCLDFMIMASTGPVKLIVVDHFVEEDHEILVDVLGDTGCKTQQDFVEAANDALAEARQNETAADADWKEIDGIINNQQ